MSILAENSIGRSSIWRRSQQLLKTPDDAFDFGQKQFAEDRQIQDLSEIADAKFN